MNKDHAYILTINGGSSTIRFALFQNDESLMHLLNGKIDRIGLNDSKLTFNDGKENQKDTLKVTSYDPDHLPAEIELIKSFRKRHPKLPQVACFDTAFHYTMPRVAKLLPIPRRFDTMGIMRYGFHGLSYAYMMEELTRGAGAKAAQGRVMQTPRLFQRITNRSLSALFMLMRNG